MKNMNFTTGGAKGSDEGGPSWFNGDLKPVRSAFLQGLSAIYFIAFISVYLQIEGEMDVDLLWIRIRLVSMRRIHMHMHM